MDRGLVSRLDHQDILSTYWSKFHKSFLYINFFRAEDDLLTSGVKIEKLIVAHPAIDKLVEVQLLYIAYNGWIYSGRYQWSIDKLVITDSQDQKVSFCKESGELLLSGVPTSLKLSLGDCSASIAVKPEFRPLPIDEVKSFLTCVGHSQQSVSDSVIQSVESCYFVSN